MGWVGAIVQPLKCLLRRHEDLSLSPRVHIQNARRGGAYWFQCWRGGAGGSLIHELQGKEGTCLKNQGRQSLRNNIQGWPLASSTHRHRHTDTYTHMGGAHKDVHMLSHPVTMIQNSDAFPLSASSGVPILAFHTQFSLFFLLFFIPCLSFCIMVFLCCVFVIAVYYLQFEMFRQHHYRTTKADMLCFMNLWCSHIEAFSLSSTKREWALSIKPWPKPAALRKSFISIRRVLTHSDVGLSYIEWFPCLPASPLFGVQLDIVWSFRRYVQCQTQCALHQ